MQEHGVRSHGDPQPNHRGRSALALRTLRRGERATGHTMTDPDRARRKAEVRDRLRHAFDAAGLIEGRHEDGPIVADSVLDLTTDIPLPPDDRPHSEACAV